MNAIFRLSILVKNFTGKRNFAWNEKRIFLNGMNRREQEENSKEGRDARLTASYSMND